MQKFLCISQIHYNKSMNLSIQHRVCFDILLYFVTNFLMLPGV